MTLKLNGYSTAMFGKRHEAPVWENNPMGPFEHWPSGGGGFEYFYDFIGGENNQSNPALFEGTVAVEPPATLEEGYHLTEDLADHAVNWIRQQKALIPDKPFFIYFSPGATHSPHHAEIPTWDEMANFNGMAALETPEFMLSKMDEFGSPESYNHYAVGWAHAMDTPYRGCLGTVSRQQRLEPGA
jgi:arylsulfatase A-like enzyme